MPQTKRTTRSAKRTSYLRAPSKMCSSPKWQLLPGKYLSEHGPTSGNSPSLVVEAWEYYRFMTRTRFQQWASTERLWSTSSFMKDTVTLEKPYLLRSQSLSHLLLFWEADLSSSRSLRKEYFADPKFKPPCDLISSPALNTFIRNQYEQEILEHQPAL